MWCQCGTSQLVQELHIGGNVIELHEGDTIMFDARRPHGMCALGGTPLKFIAIII